MNKTGAFNYLDIKTGSELNKTIQENRRCVVIFGYDDSSNHWMDFAINKYSKEIKFVRSTIEDGLIYGLNEASIIAFLDGKLIKQKLHGNNAMSFTKWAEKVVNPTGKTISSPEILKQILRSSADSIITIDEEVPNRLKENYTYSISHGVFDTLNLSLEKGAYLFRACDRNILPITEEEIPAQCPFDDGLKINISNKDFLAGFLLPENSAIEDKTFLLLNKIKEKFGEKVFAISLSTNIGEFYAAQAKLTNVARPAFVVLNTQNLSDGSWYINGLEETILNETKIFDFIDKVIKGEVGYSILSKPKELLNRYGPLKEISYSLFNKTVLETENPTIVAFTAPWCHHCHKLIPIMNATAAAYESTPVRFYFFDSTANQMPDATPEIEGYPAVFLWNGREPKEFDGNRSIDGFAQFLLNQNQIEIPEYNETELLSKYKKE